MINRLRDDLKVFMKSKDMESLNVIRGILNEINIREMKNIKITDEEIVKVFRSEIKKRKEAIESFEKGGRQDLIDKESREIKVIEKYLPADITDAELIDLIKKTAENSADKSFGAVMKASIAAAAGRADGKRISVLVKQVVK
ncbi:MAG: GatB/YqeY domain-containing protein [Elusimicrobiota bacterium]|jgi:uncharacterized protein YqeY|nr:GatB/YqeY domain-containing protein [Elusimicrobiota bacterium]